MPLTILELALRLAILAVESMTPEQRQRGWVAWFAFWDGLKPDQQKVFWETLGSRFHEALQKFGQQG